jgi:hypothetical protein
VPRQNGKNGILEMMELFKAVIQGRKILHTAHEVKTCRKAFLRLKSFFEDDQQYPELVEEVIAIRQTNGQEAIFLRNGGSIEFIARSKSSGRGFTVDDIVCDEAQEFTDEQQEALMPTISAAPSRNPQFILTGTPPNSGSPGTVFLRTRKDARADGASDVCWFEWSVAEIGDVADTRRWEATNPAIGYRILAKTIQTELASMSEDGFARERLGWWSPESDKNLITSEEWNALATNDPPEKGRLSYGVKFSPDGQMVALAVALRPRKGPIYVEVIEHRSMREGIGWVARMLSDRWRGSVAIVIDGLTGAPSLVEELSTLQVPKKVVYPPKPIIMASASAMLLNAMHAKLITHFDQPALNVSVLNAQKRKIGTSGGWGWGGDDVDVTPVEAVSLAHWGVVTSKRDPARKQRLL